MHRARLFRPFTTPSTLWAGVLLAGLSACTGSGTSSDDDDLTSCTVGSPRACTCSSGASGTQSCVELENGNTAFLACACGSGSSSSSGGGSSAFPEVSPVVAADLLAADATGPDNVWAVGSSNTVIRFDGTSWTLVPSPLDLGDLDSVATVSATDAWVVASQSNTDRQAAHWDGTTWTRQERLGAPNGNRFDIWDVARSPQGTLWAVMSDSHGAPLRLSTWSSGTQNWSDAASLDVEIQLAWLAAGSDTDVYFGDAHGRLFHWDGASAQPVGGAPSETVHRGWADGAGALYVPSKQGLTRFKDGVWTALSPADESRMSVHGCSPTDVWSAGTPYLDGRGGQFLRGEHVEGAGSTLLEGAQGWAKAHVVCTSTTVWVFGDEGRMAKVVR